MGGGKDLVNEKGADEGDIFVFHSDAEDVIYKRGLKIESFGIIKFI